MVYFEAADDGHDHVGGQPTGEAAALQLEPPGPLVSAHAVQAHAHASLRCKHERSDADTKNVMIPIPKMQRQSVPEHGERVLLGARARFAGAVAEDIDGKCTCTTGELSHDLGEPLARHRRPEGVSVAVGWVERCQQIVVVNGER
eukprot:4178149-Prymnesium_polylepis.2